ncbi:MAG: hypothetical protein ACYC23_23155 [Limisphaerales bacterium]
MTPREDRFPASAPSYNPTRDFLPAAVLVILLGAGLARSHAAEAEDVAELAISCQVTWSSTTSWGKELKDSEGQPYRLAIAANETVHLDNDTRFQRREGSWEEVESRAVVTVDGSGTYSSSGENPINKTVGSFAKEPVPTQGLVRILSVDFEQGYAILTVTRPVTETRPECLECGFIAIAALTDCLGSINTNATPAPKEYRIEFPPGTEAFTASQSFNWSQTGACGSDSIAVTISLAYTPGQWEAVIIPPPDFDQWLPAGGVDADTPGSSLGVSIQLRHKGETEPATDMTGTHGSCSIGDSPKPTATKWQIPARPAHIRVSIASYGCPRFLDWPRGKPPDRCPLSRWPTVDRDQVHPLGRKQGLAAPLQTLTVAGRPASG